MVGKIGKIFSNRWKTGEKFFQSLEKSGRIFQPLESFFQSLENLRAGAGAREILLFFMGDLVWWPG
jgi:hypothetical protein